MSDITADTVVQRRGDLLANDLSETETVMLDVAGGSYYGIKDVAKAIWDHLESSMRVSDLCDELTKEFDVDPGVCRDETLVFLQRLDDRGLIVVTQ
ncbi:MAG TPA: PqqD family protein [Acidimicrobiia bacterium]|nr:PqqD family protein [Acidimicrobiia bacterium]